MKYHLEGIDGNAFAIMGYVKNAMRREKFSKEEIDSYTQDAISSNYQHLLTISLDMVDKCNEHAMGNHIEEED